MKLKSTSAGLISILIFFQAKSSFFVFFASLSLFWTFFLDKNGFGFIFFRFWCGNKTLSPFVSSLSSSSSSSPPQQHDYKIKTIIFFNYASFNVKCLWALDDDDDDATRFKVYVPEMPESFERHFLFYFRVRARFVCMCSPLLWSSYF